MAEKKVKISVGTIEAMVATLRLVETRVVRTRCTGQPIEQVWGKDADEVLRGIYMALERIAEGRAS